MAKGADSEEFVVLSKVRSGHKREFQFALRSQNEIGESLGRTRFRKAGSNGSSPSPSPPGSESPSPVKKMKRPVGRPRKKNKNSISEKVVEEKKKLVVVALESEDEPKSDVVDVMTDDDNNNDLSQLVESQRRRENGDDDDVEQVKIIDPVVENENLGNSANAATPMVVEDDKPKERESNEETISTKPTTMEERVVEKCAAVKRVPTQLRELLETGLLEGFAVKYIRGCKRAPLDTGLAGIIRGSGILCFCDECKGAQVVRPNQFELHAGSSNKRPTDYIYLENGKTFRDVLNACKNADLHSVATTILDAIGSLSKRKSLSCSICKEPVSEAVRGGTALLCCSCTELKSSRMTTTQASASNERSSRSRKPVSVRKVSSTASKTSSSSTKPKGKITRKDLRLHKLVFLDDFLPDGTEVGYYVRGKKLLSGYKKGFGIVCSCCNTEVSPSTFEAHAGWASRRKPYLHIYTSNGASLHELSLTLSRTQKFSTEENDDLCSICYDAGDLLCCDGCPRSFHIECIPLPRIPQDKWYCKYCEDMFQKEKFAERNPNAIAAGRVAGVDPIEQITNRCIRIVKILDTQVGVNCALCSDQDFCKSGFGPRTVIICDQCEKEYHVGCLKEHKIKVLEELPEGDWFCCSDCERIHFALKKLVEHGEQKLPDCLVDIIKKKMLEKGLDQVDLDIRWRVFNQKWSCLDEIRSELAKAVSVFHEQFGPIHYGKQDLVPHIVYGRDLKDKELGGMFCAVLSVNATIISTGVFRIFGKEVAEVPLVATSKGYEGKGYFQCLYSCIEKLLRDLDVKDILLPAAEEAMSLWTDKFGFNVMPQEECDKFQKRYNLVMFDSTPMLRKPVPRS